MLRKIKPILVLMSLLGAFCLYAVPARGAGAAPGLTMEAAAAFEGHFKYGEWLPVWVQLENNGTDLDAEVHVHVPGSYSATTFAVPVSLPTGSRKLVPVYVLPNNFARELRVQLVSLREGEILLTQNVAVKSQPNISFLVGLIAAERGALSLIASASTEGTQRPIVLVDVGIDDLPERAEGLGSFDCLVLNDIDSSSLSQAQRTALIAWVRRGGRLVIGGGAGARQTTSGIPESILPFIPRHEIQVDSLPGLSSLGGDKEVRVPGPFLVSSGDLSEGWTLAVQPTADPDGLPLVRERSVGDGLVDFVALDLARSPFDAWAGTVHFWGRLVLDSAIYPAELPPDVSPRQLRADQLTYALSNLPSLALPSVRGLSVLLGVYIVLVGPVNYGLLRWRKRLHWAWVSIPLITLLFSGGAFVLGYALRGTDLIMNKIALISLRSDGTTLVSNYVGLFSPTQQSYEIEVQSNDLLSPLNPGGYGPFGPGGTMTAGDAVFVQGDPGHLRGLAVNQWSMQTFMIETSWPELGQVSGDLWFEDQALVGSLHNETQVTLYDAVVVFGSHFVRLGDLAPGEQAAVRLDLSYRADEAFGPPLSYRLFEEAFSRSGPNGPPRDAQIKQQILDSLLNESARFSPVSSISPVRGGATQGLMLLAWLDRSPPEVRVAGREPIQQTTALLYSALTYRLDQEGTISVPPGFVSSQVTKTPVDGGICGPPGTPAVYIGIGDAEFEFQLPQDVLDVQVEQLTLFVRSDGGWQRPDKVELYDWDEAAWVELSEAVLGDNIVDKPTGLVRRDGLVRARLSVASRERGGCFYLGLGFQGTR